MSGRKYYCFCDSNCKFETMTKEQILAAIAEAAASGLVFDTESAFISKVKESNAGGMVTFWRGTQAQYNALAKIDADCFYIITDAKEQQLKYTTALVTLNAESWGNKQQNVAVSGVKVDNLVIVSPAPAAENAAAYAESGIRCVEQSGDRLTFECSEVPSVNIAVNVAVFS